MDRPRTTEPVTRAQDEPRPERTGRVAGVVGLLALVAICAALAGRWSPPVKHEAAIPLTPPPIPTPLPTMYSVAEVIEPMDARPWNLTWLGIALGATLLGWILFLVLRWFRRHPPPPVPEAPDDADIESGDTVAGPGTVLPHLPTLREGVAAADVQLRRFARPADAVIAAWVRLEEAAARSGVVRDPAATPTEFTLKVLDATPVDQQSTRTLLGLYLRARFGGERMAPDDVATAMLALTVLAVGLGEDDPSGEVQP